MRQHHINLNDLEYTDLFMDIRGYPRPLKAVRDAEKELGAKLVTDDKVTLLYKLDTALEIVWRREGEYPDGITIFDEPGKIFIPIVFNLSYGGLNLPIYNKPAWFEYKTYHRVTK